MNSQDTQEPSSKRPKLCGHCNRTLSLESYRVHYQKFYNSTTSTWRREDQLQVQAAEPFVPTLLRESAFIEAGRNRLSSESSLSTTNDTSDVQFSSCESQGVYDEENEVCNTQDDRSESSESEDELASSGDESSSTDKKQDQSLPYNLERIMRAYTLCILFLQFQHSLSDTCIDSFLKATHTFLEMIAKVSTSDSSLTNIATAFPRSLYRLKSWLHVPKSTFQEYALCPTCGWVYEGDTCKRSHDAPFLCTNTQFPNHPQESWTQQCKTPLTRISRTSVRPQMRVKLLQTLCYNPITDQLANLLRRFDKELDPRPIAEVSGATHLFDVQDGPVHRSRLAMLRSGSHPEEKHLVLNINIDWFQPYKHVTHSVGAIYASVNNLPRQFRYQMENVLLLAVIPGPREPAQMSSILTLLVDELKELQLGVHINGTVVKVALGCMASDLPAARKASGFTSHSSTFGCSRCLKRFPHSAAMKKVDSSGYDVDSWEPRRLVDVVAHGIEHQRARSQAERVELAKQTGVKYSPLQTLDYFSTVSDTVIDPMHNLFLGVAKTVVHTWKENKLLSGSDCARIQSIANSIAVPRDIGRIPAKLGSGFSSMTADEWRTWTLLYSAMSLLEVLPPGHRHCWDLFIRACTVLCSKVITGSLCDYGRENMVSFCHSFQALYGNAACVPNMHFSCHLDEYLRDHGPAHGFWLFPFERMNGLLGDTHTNKQDISTQFMRHFITKCTTWTKLHDLPSDLSTAFFQTGFTTSTKKTSGGVLRSCDVVDITRSRLPLQLGIPSENLLDVLTSEKIPQALIRPSHNYLPSSTIENIHKLFSMLSRRAPESIHIDRSTQSAAKCTCGDTVYTASTTARRHDIYGRAWADNGQQVTTSAGHVQQFYDIHAAIDGKQASVIIAEVSWHDFTGNTSIPFPWQEVALPRMRAERPSRMSFLPVACILSRAARMTHHGRDVIAPVDFIVDDSILHRLM